ncbi:hypothetical protein ScPMuIL_013995 [Solemya velum]
MVEQSEVISEDEAALYDRQIRLWGLDAQKRLHAARVLVIGMRGLGAEVVKNVVLAGVKSITLLDHSQVTKEDACSQFLVHRSEIGKNRAESSLEKTQKLNPMVNVKALPDEASEKPDDFFLQFSVICATCCSSELLQRLDNLCFKNNIKFFAGDVFGYYGFMFSDLGQHEYAEEVLKKLEPSTDVDEQGESCSPPTKKKKVDDKETVVVKKSVTFCRLQNALEFDWSSSDAKTLKKTPNTYFIFLLSFIKQMGRRPAIESKEEDKNKLQAIRQETLEQMKINPDTLQEEIFNHCFAEVGPVCAIVGGVLAQEIIKAVSHKDQPHNNFFFYNGMDGSGLVDCIGATTEK